MSIRKKIIEDFRDINYSSIGEDNKLLADTIPIEKILINKGEISWVYIEKKEVLGRRYYSLEKLEDRRVNEFGVQRDKKDGLEILVEDSIRELISRGVNIRGLYLDRGEVKETVILEDNDIRLISDLDYPVDVRIGLGEVQSLKAKALLIGLSEIDLEKETIGYNTETGEPIERMRGIIVDDGDCRRVVTDRLVEIWVDRNLRNIKPRHSSVRSVIIEDAKIRSDRFTNFIQYISVYDRVEVDLGYNNDREIKGLIRGLNSYLEIKVKNVGKLERNLSTTKIRRGGWGRRAVRENKEAIKVKRILNRLEEIVKDSNIKEIGIMTEVEVVDGGRVERIIENSKLDTVDLSKLIIDTKKVWAKDLIINSTIGELDISNITLIGSPNTYSLIHSNKIDKLIIHTVNKPIGYILNSINEIGEIEWIN